MDESKLLTTQTHNTFNPNIKIFKLNGLKKLLDYIEKFKFIKVREMDELTFEVEAVTSIFYCKCRPTKHGGMLQALIMRGY